MPISRSQLYFGLLAGFIALALINSLGSNVRAAFLIPELTTTPTPTPTPTATLLQTPTPTGVPTQPPNTPTPESNLKWPLVFVSQRDGNKELYSIENGQLSRLTNNSVTDEHPAMAPYDGTIIFSSGRDGNREIYKMNLDGSAQTRLTVNNWWDEGASWSPLSLDQIAITSSEFGYSDIFIMDINNGKTTLLSNDGIPKCCPSWSPDGQRIAFETNRDSNHEIYVMDSSGQNSINISNSTSDDFYPAWSPDGRHIAFASNRDGNTEIYIMNPDGTGQRNLTNHPANDTAKISWSPDGQMLAFTSDRDGNKNIYVMNADGSNQTQLTEDEADDSWPSFPAFPIASPTITPTDTPIVTPTNTPTTPTVPAEGDTFEIDDDCSSAREISMEQIQTHTFHDVGDVDWMKFNAQEGMLYRVEVQVPDSSNADVNVELYSRCDDTNFEQWNQTFSPGARIDFTAPMNGFIYLRLANQDAGIFGDDMVYETSVRELVENDSSKAAIIVAGRLRRTDRLQDNIHNVTDAVYKMFQDQGYSPEQIYYLATDSSLVGYDGAATAASLQAAITSWATDHVKSDGVLNLYMVDHGGPSTFYIDGVSGQQVNPAQLHEWLSEFEQTVCNPLNCTTLPKINVFIEACQSGSFIERPNSISQSNRVIVTSSSASNDAIASRSGAYFSDHFITDLSQGKNVLTSFVEAKTTANRVYTLQDAWLDADGNGVANQLTDSSIASTRGFLFANTLGDNWAPHIFDVQSPEIVISSSGVITADARDNQKIDLVWAVVYPPDYETPATQQVLQAEMLDNFLLSPIGIDDLYTGRFSGFTQTGRYRIVVHAEDNDGLRARPIEIDVMINAESVYRTFLPMITR